MSLTNTLPFSPMCPPTTQVSSGTDPGPQVGPPGPGRALACRACVNRRAFLTTLAGAAGASGLMPLAGGSVLAASAPSPGAKTRIRLVFSHHRDDAQGRQSEAGWPFL